MRQSIRLDQFLAHDYLDRFYAGFGRHVDWLRMPPGKAGHIKITTLSAGPKSVELTLVIRSAIL